MKKIFLLALGLAVSAGTMSANAQETSTSPVKFGIKAGGTYMMGGKFVATGVEYTSKFEPGFTGGVFVNIPLGGSLGMMPELSYTQKNTRLQETVTGTEFKVKTRTGYVELPILLTYQASPAVHFVLGPQVSFLTGQKTKNYANDVMTSETTDTDDFRKSIAGAVVGLGYNISTNMMLNLRYSMDFQSIVEDSVNQDKAKINGFGLTLGYAF